MRTEVKSAQRIERRITLPELGRFGYRKDQENLSGISEV